MIRKKALIILVLFLVSCSHISGILEGRESRDRRVRETVLGHISSGGYERAVKTIADERKSRNSPQLYDDLYSRAMSGIVSAGLEARDRGDCLSAGKRFRSAEIHLRSYGVKDTAGMPGREEIRSLIRECSDMLNNEGLKEYRAGNLKNAISIWESILRFDPENRPVKKAIGTARVQLRNLESIDNKE